ncbi:helix-turn-helix domain-containing protein [Streptomyces sp. CBMA291]|uniref:AraC-like ligand-binding domain-containing protein n=1 Tax=Streptomyces sp. CBMA291 TaxID=1930279 RepID=UPI001661511B|nr:helix-turn-helix domain-containing protein [Streptomyces sp. CBMA291]
MNPEEPADPRPAPGGARRHDALLTTLSSESVRAEDRFEWYADQVRRHIFPLALSTPYTEDFPSRVSALRLGTAQLAHFSFPPLHAARTARHIRRDDPETYQLGWIRRSSMRVGQLRGHALAGPDDMVLFDTSHPLEAGVPEEGGRAEVVVLRIARSALPLPATHTDRLLSLRLAPGGVSGMLLRRHLGALLDHAAEVGPAEAHRLGTVTGDLVASFLADRLDASGLLPWESRTTVLRAEINAFINEHLGDPALGPAAIAAHHHLSLRSLHSLFRLEPATVAATIRRRRLERCRLDLADPRLRHRSIAALAARWGLLVPAEFSRSFRAAYGMSPGEYRAETGGSRTSAREHKRPRARPHPGASARRHDASPGFERS